MKRTSRTTLAGLITSFFHDQLQRLRGASPNTVRSYGHALRLYLVFVGELRRRSVADLRLTDLDVDSVVAFLNHLESKRGNTPATRNCRLTALRSFFRYLTHHDPVNAGQYQVVLSLPLKRARLQPATYLEPEQARVIIGQPDRRTEAGARDHSLLLFLYNTGARIAEALGVRVEDLEFGRRPQIRLRGKGNRERVCPLWRETAVALGRLLERQPPPAGGSIFRSARGASLTRDGAAYIIEKHVRGASQGTPALRRLRVTPHVFRHSCAVALLQSGVDLVVIRDYLGHASVSTTSRYVSSNLKLRRSVLEAFWKRAGIETAKADRRRPTPDILRFLESL